MKKLIAIIAVSVFTAGAAAAELPMDEAKAKSIEMVKELGGGLKKTLVSTIKESGFGDAISVCKDVAPVAAEDVSAKHGAQIHRVSLKLRNPGNKPNKVETLLLMKMDEDNAKGKLKPAYAQVVTSYGGQKSLRFMKPIVTGKVCMNCHGTDEKLNKQAIEQIKAHYPEDKATGYSPGQVRGAFSVLYPLN